MPQVEVDGLRLNYDVQGEGEPLLLLRCTPYDIDGTPLLCAELLFRPDRYAYKWTLRR